MFSVGVQNEPPQEVSQGYEGYLELKAILATSSRETSAPSFNYLEELELRDLPLIRDNQRQLLLT